MGCGDKNIDKKKRRKCYGDSSAVICEEANDHYNCVPAIFEAPPDHGISIDPATLLDVARWKIPPFPPGLVSITHQPDNRPYPSDLPGCIFEKAMKAATIVHSGPELPPPPPPPPPATATAAVRNSGTEILRCWFFVPELKQFARNGSAALAGFTETQPTFCGPEEDGNFRKKHIRQLKITLGLGVSCLNRLAATSG
ncbi:unnamed protein product [Gongylonema pulchrum]|uniref:Uncharacterized protein n=1 Tax=Gongylonema pulchrum TaxID=637853 RepID=A0A183E2U2_9BILA|nr:unnamed protein product [Gongylonema pulchrum]